MLTTARVSTYFGTQALTGASGCFFLPNERLYLATNRHVLMDRPSGLASFFGLRFLGQGLFLTDARTHSGTSGALVVMQDDTRGGKLPWKLLDVHSA